MFTPEVLVKLARAREFLATHPEEREALGRCPLCNSNIKDRTVALYKGLIRSLFRVYVHLASHGVHEFDIKEVRSMMGKNEYARFGDLVRFGGIVYKAVDPKLGRARRGYFGMNLGRADEFFRGERKIPLSIVLNQITNEIEEADYISVHEFPELVEFLDQSGLYNSLTTPRKDGSLNN